MQASPVTNSIRDAKALEVGLNKIDNAILYHNAAVLLGKTPKVTYAPVEWDVSIYVATRHDIQLIFIAPALENYPLL